MNSNNHVNNVINKMKQYVNIIRNHCISIHNIVYKVVGYIK